MLNLILFTLLSIATNAHHCSDGSGELYTAHTAHSSIAIVYCLPSQDCTWLTDENGVKAEFVGSGIVTSVTPRPINLIRFHD